MRYQETYHSRSFVLECVTQGVNTLWRLSNMDITEREIKETLITEQKQMEGWMWRNSRQD